jgi:hypothetical protein
MLDVRREGLLSDAAGLPAGPCKRCEREVLAYRLPTATDAEPAERFACAHCDEPLRRVYLVDESDLETLGYGIDDPLRQGCGTGCAAGGCAARAPSR